MARQSNTTNAGATLGFEQTLWDAAEQNRDGTTTVYFAPEQPEGVGRGNWIQTIPGRGWYVFLRLYGALEPFFDKTWRPSEIEPVP